MILVTFDPRRASSIEIDSLGEGMPGISPHYGAHLAEAAIVCLESESHTTGVIMTLDGECRHGISLIWQSLVDPGCSQRCWGDPEDATEHGAYGIAALIVSKLTGYTIIERARRGRGFDYWLGKEGSSKRLFQDKARLEVSGIREGNEKAVDSRIRQKMSQISRCADKLPGVIAIVEFGSPRSKVKCC